MIVAQSGEELLQHIAELIRAERLNEAADVLRAALEREPANPVLLVTLGDVLVRQGRTIPARRHYQRALERDPGSSVARVQLARLLAHLDDTAEAIRQYREAIKWRADTVPAYTELAALLARTGDPTGATALLSQLAERQPESADAQLALGDALVEMRRHAEAEAHFRRALTASPHRAEILVRLGASLRAQDRYEEACVVLGEALQAAPALASAARHAADLHWFLGRRGQALKILQDFLLQQPAEFGIQFELARRLDGLGQYAAARAHYESALALRPDAEEVIAALGLLDLCDGEQQRGWAGAWLTARASLGVEDSGEAVPRDVELPHDLGGRTVLLQADGGLGNELFLLRYVPQLKARGARVIYRASPETLLLLRQRALNLDGVIGPREARPECDHALFISALPLALSRLGSEPLPHPPSTATPQGAVQRSPRIKTARRVFWPELPGSVRLEPNAVRLKFWRERLAEMGSAPYIAVTWRVGTAPEAETSSLAAAVPLDALGRALAASPGTLVSIQPAPGPDELDALGGAAARKVHDAARASNDLEDALALLSLVDEYVCVSNAWVHLRASAGAAAKVLVPWPPDWRWRASGDESPWFPGFRLYRQQPDGDWTRALERLARDLASVERGKLLTA